VSDTLYSPNEIVTVVPFVGTEPANVTSPVAGARTAEEPPSATSIPRCWPDAYVSPLREKPRSTSPSAGHVHAHADEPEPSDQPSTSPRLTTHLHRHRFVVRRANMESTVPPARVSGNAK
jgi:hypothetical protein